VNKYVTILIPCYNAEKYLLDLLNSIEKQTYKYLQIILIDDGSTDNSSKIFLNWANDVKNTKFKIEYYRIKHSNQSIAINEGLKYANGRYLTWVDADDVLENNAIEEKILFLTQNKEYQIVYNNATYYTENLKESNGLVFNQQIEESSLFEYVFRGYLPCLSGIFMMKLDILKQCYPKMEIPKSEAGQNLQLLLPPLSKFKCGYINKSLLKYRKYSESHSNKKRTFLESKKRIQDFYNLLLELIPYCDCSMDYIKIAEEYSRRESARLLKESANIGRKSYENRNRNIL
jgi:glycosyltransferase involved in cell wall biosynthesis